MKILAIQYPDHKFIVSCYPAGVNPIDLFEFTFTKYLCQLHAVTVEIMSILDFVNSLPASSVTLRLLLAHAELYHIPIHLLISTLFILFLSVLLS